MKRRIALLSVIIVLLLAVTIFILYNKPEGELLIINGKSMKNEKNLIDNHLYISFKNVKKYIDEDIFLDLDENMLIITNETVRRYSLDNLVYRDGNDYKELEYPIIRLRDNIHLPIEILKDNYDLDFIYNKTRDILYIESKDRAYNLYSLTDRYIPLKLEEGLLSKFFIIDNKDKNYQVYVYEDLGKYSYIITEEGYKGYIANKKLKNIVKTNGPSGTKEEVIIRDNPINLTWDYVHKEFKNLDSIKPIKGVNVISPTFYSLDKNGNLVDKSNKYYRERYNRLGIDVWPVFDNNFDPNLTSKLLSSSKKREELIDELVYLFKKAGYQGINIDFENVYYKDKDNMTQFVRELYPFFKKEGIKVSMDITAISTSENWSMFYDRERLAKTTDYLVFMGYDQHWASSPIAGSVAEYTWVENNLQKLLELIPKEKLILAVPLYARLWKEDANGLTSKALTLNGVNNFINQNDLSLVWLDDIKQYYGEIRKEDGFYRIWVEDDRSLSNRTRLVLDYELAGLASWRKGFEGENTFKVLDEGLRKDE